MYILNMRCSDSEIKIFVSLENLDITMILMEDYLEKGYTLFLFCIFPLYLNQTSACDIVKKKKKKKKKEEEEEYANYVRQITKK